ncbi:hypothetical protein DH2020_031499 [Rehmannia glutinosa]|uniref:Uncharacterized protein n=1 Tax=Rehmannia glutinosa TaxID=99300 RepID=A0ABR0VHU3_REHGL
MAMATLLETCRVLPPPTAELTVPLTFFDIRWIHFHPIRRLLFYDYPCSKEHFLDTLVPKLKQSLSLTLKHYLPLAGNLLYPLNIDDEKPVFRYVAGDSVSLTIAESSNGFDELVGNHARDADQFYDFVPEMPPVKLDEPNYKIVPVIALQVTLFPDSGICIGFANHHSIGDASSIVGFIRAWASITQHGGDDEFILTKQGDSSLPIFDRSVIKDPNGIDSIYWKVIRETPLKSSSFPLPTNRVRATFILHRADIKKLKDLVWAKKPGLVHVSSFVVTTSYVWTCFAKSGEELVADDVLEFFGFAVDTRARVDPPVPANYFGNCFGYGIAKIEHIKLVGEEGFVIAAEAIAEDIKNRVNNKDQVLKGAENWLSEFEKLSQVRILGVSGSPKFDLCSADFGWGRAKKLEVLSIDGENYSMSLCKSADSEGGLEIGLSLPKERMEAFAAIFADGLR